MPLRLTVPKIKSRLFPFLRALLATVPVLAITVYLYVESRGTERLLLEAETVRQSDNASLQIQGFLNARIEALKNVANFNLTRPPNEENARFSAYVTRVIDENPGFVAIGWFDAGGQVKTVAAASRRNGSFGSQSNQLRQAIAKAHATRNAAATDSYELSHGQQALTIVLPVDPGNETAGYIGGIIDLNQGFGSLYGSETLDYWSLEIWDHAGNDAFDTLPKPETAASPKSPPFQHLPVADRTWKFRVAPTALLIDTYRTSAPPRILIIGLLACLALAIANHRIAQREQTLAESLRESERLAADVERTRRHLSDLVNGIDAVIWESDPDASHFTFVNDYARKLLKVEAAQWVAEPQFWFEHVHADDRRRAQENLQAAREPGHTYPAEYRMIDAAGHVLWVQEIITAIGVAGSGKAVGKRGIIVDITARVQAEEALRQGQKLESLGVLAGGIAHDFNNLLTTILGNAEMLGSHLAGPAAGGRTYLDKIERTTRRLAELTRQMLAYSGRGRFTVTRIDLNAIIREMHELLTVSTRKNVDVHYRLAPKLPAIEADAVQIQQVVLNLLTNAAEAIGEHANGDVVVQTSAVVLDAAAAEELAPGQELEPGTYVKLEVSDTGCGMTEETISKIFDPFFTTKFTGRGLGLAALQGIVRGHRGGIRIFSQPGEGTVFTLYFPGSGKGVSILEPEHTAIGDSINLEEICVLVVDDEESLRGLTASALEDAGCRVLQSADGEDGVKQFRQHATSIDLVVLDLTMPKLSGEEAFHQMIAIRPDACVMISSGYTQEDVASQFTGHVLGGFIEKPFTPSELIAKIRTVLAAWRQKEGVELPADRHR